MTTTPQAIEAIGWLINESVVSERPSVRDFAESEVILPDGPYKGEAFRCDTQPFAGLFFDEVDSGHWHRVAATGPTQTGKTLICYVVPILWHLFALRETVICGIPAMDIAQDKWQADLLPVIEASPTLRELLPTRGEGSRGGMVKRAVKFRNGSTLRFMSGGGGDKQRAGYTSRVLAVTETDGMDEPAQRSREADKVTQLEGRTRAFGRLEKQVYLECTVTIPTGRIWQEYTNGTRSRIVLPCPHCKAWVTPEREHLRGWQEASSEMDAYKCAHFCCPECKDPWTEKERVAANERGRLVHRGQTVGPRGKVGGNPPDTETLGFRWSAVHNLLLSAGDVAVDEWKAVRSTDEENAERELRQYVWAIPYEPAEIELTPLDSQAVRRRTARGFPLRQLPDDVGLVTVGVDLGKWLAHYVVIAWTSNDRCHVPEYGVLEIDSDRLGVATGTLTALREFRDTVLEGWPRRQGEPVVPAQVWIDSNYEDSRDAVYAFCAESAEQRFRPTRGHGFGQALKRYRHPEKTDQRVRVIGEHFYLVRDRKARLLVVDLNADYYKSRLHERLSQPSEGAGALTLFDAPGEYHTKFAKHMTAERPVQRFVPGIGEVVQWQRIGRRQNHYLDAGSLALAAGHFCRQQAGPKGGGRWSPLRDSTKPAQWFGARKDKTQTRGRKEGRT